ncbi:MULTISPECIES: hypothetical protein [unclassified Acidovorax]|uniref:hypothetical protein n=1 Tax=unclassified Acidovorax TaxID=2684926 RepID=UPI0028831A18|nr:MULTISPECIES: hypothetical protein [unclassified Acidovorax]
MPSHHFSHTSRWITAAACTLTLAGCSSLAGRTPSQPSAEAAPTVTACPAQVPPTATCYGGRDSAGAFYLIAVPKDWAGTLVLHAHGGPELGAPKAERTAEDLTRWAVMVRAGYAWAGSTFRQGGVAVSAAAEDTERLRRIFNDHIAVPRHTVLHGQSWGAGVAARAADLFTVETVGRQPYDAVLLTSGVLGGGSRSYDVRTDLRAVYQYLCNNHPRPTEPAYALNLGLPAGAHMSRADLQARANECLGLDRPAAQRTPVQQGRIETLERVLRIPASSIQSHLAWATFHFQDISSHRTGGASPFGNVGVAYSGSGDDAALNAGVPRLKADAQAARRFAADTDPTGRIPVPVLSVKWIGDPTAFVELDSQFRTTMERAGSGDRLVQTFTRQGTHSYISDPTYPALVAALLDWVERGAKPTPEQVAARCRQAEAQFGAGCSFEPGYATVPLASRVPERERP